MAKMLNTKAARVFFVLFVFVSSHIAYAGTISPRRNLDFGDIEEIIDNVTTFLWILLVAVTIVFFLLAGFKYLTAGGNPEAVRAANKMVVYGMIALAIGFIARGVPFLVSSIVG